MAPILIREYRARWQAASEIEHAELQQATLEDRWEKLNAILRMAAALRLENYSEDETGVWQRWARLKVGSA